MIAGTYGLRGHYVEEGYVYEEHKHGHRVHQEDLRVGAATTSNASERTSQRRQNGVNVERKWRENGVKWSSPEHLS